MSGSAQGQHVFEADDANNRLANIFGSLLPTRLTRDGQVPKRRGPRPDSKPAKNKRQERNRQAQRSHRERRELYLRTLEEECIRYRDLNAQLTPLRDGAVTEISELRALLAAHRIDASAVTSYIPQLEQLADLIAQPMDFDNKDDHYRPDSPAGDEVDASAEKAAHSSMDEDTPDDRSACLRSKGVTEEMRIEFVVDLEEICKNHMPMGHPSMVAHGHANLFTTPPHAAAYTGNDLSIAGMGTKIAPKLGPSQHLEDPVKRIQKLYHLSKALPLEGQLTPVMALRSIIVNKKSRYLTPKTFKAVQAYLKERVRCYGFGATLEQSQVDEAMDTVVGDIPSDNVEQIFSFDSMTFPSIEPQTTAVNTKTTTYKPQSHNPYLQSYVEPYVPQSTATPSTSNNPFEESASSASADPFDEHISATDLLDFSPSYDHVPHDMGSLNHGSLNQQHTAQPPLYETLQQHYSPEDHFPVFGTTAAYPINIPHHHTFVQSPSSDTASNMMFSSYETHSHSHAHWNMQLHLEQQQQRFEEGSFAMPSIGNLYPTTVNTNKAHSAMR